jgi:hypothetical protein
LAQFAQIQQIQGGRQAQEMNALKMQEAQAAMEERNALRQLNPAAEDYENQLFRVNPTLGIQYRKERSAAEASAAATAASRASASTSEFELKAKQRKFGEDLKRGLSSNPSDANIIAFGEDAVLQGLYTPDQVQATVQQLLALPAQERVRILSQAGASPSELKPTTNVGPTGIVQTPAFGGAATIVPGTEAAFQMTPAQIAQGVRDQQRLGFEGQRVGFEGQRVGFEGKRLGLENQRVGLEGQRVDIARTEAERKAQGLEALPPKEIQKREAAFPQATSAVKGIEYKATGFIKDLEELRDHPGLSSITGIAAGRLPGITAEGRAAQAIYDKIVAKGGFQALQEMRDASKTGGALGNVSNQEGTQLKASFAAIDRRQDANDVKKAIKDAIVDIERTTARMREAYESTYSYKSGGGAAPASSTGVDASNPLLK